MSAPTTDMPPAILVVVDRPAVTRWLKRLVDTLERATRARIMLRLEMGKERPDSALGTLYALEKLVLRRGRPSDADPLDDPEWLGARIENPDIVPRLAIDLTTAGTEAPVPVLRPTCQGHAGEEAVASAILFDGAPRVAILRLDPGDTALREVACGTVSLEAAGGVSGGVEAVKSRMTALLIKAIRDWDHPGGASAGSPAGRPAMVSHALLAKRAGRMVAAAAARAAYRLCFNAPHWHVGWRFVSPGNDVFSRRDLAGEPWARLADSVHHFYADPFPFFRDRRDYIFFEDLDHRHGRGIISMVEFDATGRPGPVRPVLEEDCHLSYPFMIERDGQVFMIPETSAKREIAIYRAAEFPFRWEKLAVLVSDVEAADATVIEVAGTWWMFAVTRDGVGGYSDTLEIWHAPDLFGPWQPIAGNPVLVDDRSARPAGCIIRQGDALYRPVQDCRARYGAALGIARIDRLDEEGFSQSVETVLAPDRHWPGRRLHTLNYNGRLEVIDGEAPRFKFGR